MIARRRIGFSQPSAGDEGSKQTSRMSRKRIVTVMHVHIVNAVREKGILYHEQAEGLYELIKIVFC